LNQSVDVHDIYWEGCTIEDDHAVSFSQNSGRLNCRDRFKTCTSQQGCMKFCMLIDLQRMNKQEDRFREIQKKEMRNLIAVENWNSHFFSGESS
jgi:hypothetical protein